MLIDIAYSQAYFVCFFYIKAKVDFFDRYSKLRFYTFQFLHMKTWNREQETHSSRFTRKEEIKKKWKIRILSPAEKKQENLHSYK